MLVRIGEADKGEVGKRPESQGAVVKEILAGGSKVVGSSSRISTLKYDDSDWSLSDWISGLNAEVEQLNLPTTQNNKRRRSSQSCRDTEVSGKSTRRASQL